MTERQRAVLEFPANEAGFVETLATKMGWRVIPSDAEVIDKNTAEEIDWSKYPPEIQQLRRLQTKITAEDIAHDARLAYILSK